jgi:hypothetical protein
LHQAFPGSLGGATGDRAGSSSRAPAGRCSAIVVACGGRDHVVSGGTSTQDGTMGEGATVLGTVWARQGWGKSRQLTRRVFATGATDNSGVKVLAWSQRARGGVRLGWCVYCASGQTGSPTRSIALRGADASCVSWVSPRQKCTWKYCYQAFFTHRSSSPRTK